MTAYFDDLGGALQRSRQLIGSNHECDADFDLRTLEETLVYDVTLCLESPGFPADLREKGHRIILQHGVNTRPLNDLTHPRWRRSKTRFGP